MARISGVDLPKEKRIDIALGVIYGLGRNNVGPILKAAKVEPQRRVKELTEEEVNRLQKIITTHKVEGDLRREVQEHIKRLREIGAYRGLRHARGLPARGQRTRSNARTKRGKRVTIGAIRKKVAEKMGLLDKGKQTGGTGGK
ncbi:30S ribosomal protein S13 [Candidatus Microgenomates bacterium]|nr:30S ribosomal protein S13 [Candidatus Microgenomates bacterium]